ncbi:centromere protein S-like [Battus philenor]|uniref:centromere protein S-like n=1 Tax=Battus philenor TaxID=42288 RepID=UPI0035CF8F23
MTSFENLTKSQRTRATLHRDVISICNEACHLLGLEMTKPAMEIIAELLYKKITVYGLDLEAFAKHAKRSTINGDDVKLLVRRNPSLKTHLSGILSNLQSIKIDKRRKTNATMAVVNDTPAKNKPQVESEKAEKNKEDGHSDFEMDDRNDNRSLNETIDLTFD